MDTPSTSCKIYMTPYILTIIPMTIVMASQVLSVAEPLRVRKLALTSELKGCTIVMSSQVFSVADPIKSKETITYELKGCTLLMASHVLSVAEPIKVRKLSRMSSRNAQY